LAIRIPEIMNMALGEKITWIFITGESNWWKKILEVNYINQNRTLLLRKIYPIRTFSHLWCLIKKMFPSSKKTLLRSLEIVNS